MGQMSKGQSELVEIIERLLPAHPLTYEYHVGDRLRLDIYIKSLNVGVEYHGIQHFKFSQHFHQSKEGFLDSIKRDFEKVDRCKELGIGLVVFTHKDKLTDSLVYERILNVLQAFPVTVNVPELTYEEKLKERVKEYRRQQYARAKEQRRKNR